MKYPETTGMQKYTKPMNFWPLGLSGMRNAWTRFTNFSCLSLRLRKNASMTIDWSERNAFFYDTIAKSSSRIYQTQELCVVRGMASVSWARSAGCWPLNYGVLVFAFICFCFFFYSFFCFVSSCGVFFSALF